MDEGCLTMNWLFKEEPSNYSFDALAKDKKTVWSGVRNPLAQKHLRSIKKGDLVLYYHTGGEKAVSINQFSILSWYHKEFRNKLMRSGARLMVIGYSFSDTHINDAIMDRRHSRYYRSF